MTCGEKSKKKNVRTDRSNESDEIYFQLSTFVFDAIMYNVVAENNFFAASSV